MPRRFAISVVAAVAFLLPSTGARADVATAYRISGFATTTYYSLDIDTIASTVYPGNPGSGLVHVTLWGGEDFIDANVALTEMGAVEDGAGFHAAGGGFGDDGRQWSIQLSIRLNGSQTVRVFGCSQVDGSCAGEWLERGVETGGFTALKLAGA